MINVSKISATISFLIVVAYSLSAQNGSISGSGIVSYNSDGSLTVSGQKLFTTYIASNPSDIERMIQFDAINIFRLHSDLSGGIKATIDHEGGYVSIRMYTYTNSSTGKLLYKTTLSSSSISDFSGSPDTILHPSGVGTLQTDQIKDFLPYRNAWFYNMGDGDIDLLTASMAYLRHETNPLVESDTINLVKGNNYKLTQPVYLEIEVKDATIKKGGLKYPGLAHSFDINSYFNPSKIMSVLVRVNGIDTQTINAGEISSTPINIKMGDDVSFIVNNAVGCPVIEGVPGVWIARFAGDLMFYCSPTLTPGEFSPWIGFDSRVHNLQVRNYSGDSDFNLRVNDWTLSNGAWEWTWVAQRRMSANKNTYVASHTWPKYKTLSGGGIQRNNQREGLNIQFLNYWQQGYAGDYTTYSGDAMYMMGFDDDELLYLNSPHHDAKLYPPLPGGGISKLDSIPSRGMPEGAEQIYDVHTGYPVQGFPLNISVSAYRKYKEFNVNHKDSVITYNGYEIQDIGTDNSHPDGDGTGNNTAPGTVIIKSGGKVITIKMNVTSPLTIDRGFYGSLTGNRWPAYGETNIEYTLTGLNGLSVSELNKYSMCYQGCDALGTIFKQEVYLNDLSQNEKHAISTSGAWTASFNNTHPTYSAIVVYYRRTPTSTPVIISGKELKPIFLLFFGESSLEGKGLGAKIWLNDFRTSQTSEYSVQRHFGNTIKYTKPYVRTYTFRPGTETTFEVWDGDPHLFYESGIEWFQSSRTLAKRIPDSYLDGTSPDVSSPYLKFYINDQEQVNGRSGKSFTYRWNTPGEYTLRAEYRINGTLTSYQHKIRIINYSTSPALELGEITWRKPTPKEAQWLGLPNIDNYRFFEVTNVYSQYMYTDGPRANVPYVNRWADHNDYAAQYEWNLPELNYVTAFLNSYSNLDWFWNDWALHYSSNWRDNLPNGLPEYVGNEQVTRVITTELDTYANRISTLFSGLQQGNWQYTVPLVSYTDYQGYRMRTNPSCLYDLRYLFNNENGAFSGTVNAPIDPIYIQAPDITDDQKDKMELYFALKSERMILVDVSNVSSVSATVSNTYEGTTNHIASALFVKEN